MTEALFQSAYSVQYHNYWRLYSDLMDDNFVWYKIPYHLLGNLMEINANHINIYCWHTVINSYYSFSSHTLCILWRTNHDKLRLSYEYYLGERDEASLNILEVNVTLQVCIIITIH